MALWKHYIVLFGGFYDPGIASEYYHRRLGLLLSEFLHSAVYE
jgi:hypothetical protein